MEYNNTQYPFDVVYEDNHFIAVSKYPGVPSQGDKTGDTPLVEWVRQYIKEKYKKPGNVFCGLIHRIDRPVSGLVLFAKTSKALERMNQAFKDRKVKKTYLTIVKNLPSPTEGTLIHWLTRQEQKNKTFAHKKEVDNSQKAELSYKTLQSSDKYHLLEIQPVTGRQHQIRVQLASIGCSIKGDLKYGADRSNKDGSICLHSYSLSFEHPIQKTPITIKTQIPEHDIWYVFK